MDNTLGGYIERLQLMLFFSGYPLIYAVFNLLAEKRRPKDTFLNKIFDLLPFAYALSGVLFLGFILQSLYPDYSFQNVLRGMSGFKAWAFLSIIFFFRPFSKKPLISLLHSLIFFSFFICDLMMYIMSVKSIDVMQNGMKIYFSSLLLNTATLIVIAIIHFSIRTRKK